MSGTLHSTRLITRDGQAPSVELLIAAPGADPDDPTWERITLRLPDVYRADADALNWSLLDDRDVGGDGIAAEELEACFRMYRHVLNQNTPVCGHEDVIDVSTLGDTAARGSCLWCGQVMQAEYVLEPRIGPWRAASN
ncbi:hypothetical protein [Streptomyces zhihengii]